MAILKQNKNNKKITILTKHSDSKKLTKSLQSNYEQAKKVDEIYQTLLYNSNSVENAYKFKPIIM